MQKTQQQLVTVFGGSGFIGRHVVQLLARQGFRVRVAVRRPDLMGHLQPMGAVGQIQGVQANLRYPESIAQALEGADIVINLAGILHEKGAQTFTNVHEAGASAIAEAATKAGVQCLVHLSALGADIDASSRYAQSKAAGERVVLEQFPKAVILRPSVVFGPEDDFFNRFAALAKISPVLPLIGGGDTKFQPVYVDDVARAVLMAAKGEAKSGTIYELGGPEVSSFKDLMEYMLDVVGRKRFLVPVPFAFARVKAYFLQLMPTPLLTVDQVRLLEQDTVVSGAAIAENRTLSGLGITASGVEAIVPTYLEMYRATGQFANYRG